MNLKALPLLLIIPLLTCLLNIAIVVERNPFHSSWADPTYAYFFNGLNLASGHFKAGLVDHPGTPLHIYTGVTMKFFHLFRSEHNIVRDVIRNPEWYLYRICLTSCFVISLCILIAGWLTMRFTGNLFYALLIQATHLISVAALFFSQNLMTEFILVVTGLLVAPLIVAYSFSDHNRRNLKLILAAGILCGIMFAGKISSFPVVFVWLIMIKNHKHRLVYLLTVVLSFILFTFPGWHQAPEFFKWIINMTTHTGHYGQGDEGFANWNNFFINLNTVVNDLWMFTITFFIITFILLKQSIDYVRNLKALQNKQKKSYRVLKHSRSLIGIWVAFVVLIFLVCKQYSYHYLIPVHLLVVPAWIILIQEYYEKLRDGIAKRATLLKFIPILFSIFLLGMAIKRYDFFPGLQQPNKILLAKAQQYKYDLLLLDCGITAPFPHPALFFGVNYSAEQTSYYFSELDLYYKDFYFVKTDNGKLKNWRSEFNPNDVLKNNMQILYYSSNNKFNIDSLQWQDGNIKVDTVLLSYKLPNTGESISVLKIKREVVDK